jgi:preprotein translocase subunit SecE
MATPSTVKPPRFKFIAESISELRKVTWLSRREAIYLTTLVLAFSATVGIILAGLDYLFSFLVNKFFVGG